MADQVSKLPVLDGADGTTGSSAPSISIQVAGKDGSGNLRTILTDTTGNIGVLLKDSAGTGVTLGQKTTSSSLPVTLASNQPGINTFLDQSGTGTISALNGTVVMTTPGTGTLQFNTSGTWVATLIIEGLVNATWIAISGDIDTTDVVTTTFTGNSLVTVNSGGFSQIRVRASLYTSGTITIDWNSGAGVALVEIFNASGNQLKVKDVIDTTAQYRAQSVTTTAAQALGASTILINRKTISITPTNGTIYWATNSSVTITTGIPLFAFQTLVLSFTDNVPVWIISAGTVDTRILEAS